MNPDIEKYLNDEMSPEERAQFEQRLGRDPDLRTELEEQRAFLDRLKTQMLREKIAAALAENGPATPPKRPRGRTWIWMFVLLIVPAVTFWMLSRDGSPAEDPMPPPPSEEKQEPPGDPSSPSPQSKEAEGPAPKEQPRPPIAGLPEVEPAPDRPSVRGKAEDPGEWERFVASVWVTRFEPGAWRQEERYAPVAELLQERQFTDAYVQLQLLEMTLPENDTLHFLKGYCLLEMREGGEALRYFAKLPGDNPWRQEVEWYSVLALLLQGEREQALTRIRLIAQDAGHPFREEARDVLDRMR